MFWRFARENDLDAAFALCPAEMGAELVGPARARILWKTLLKQRAVRAFAVETGHASRVPIVGFGAGVFVSASFIDQEIASPRPGLNARILASFDHGPRVVLDEDEIARGNTFDALDVVFMAAAVRSGLPERDDQAVRAQLWLACLDAYRGFRFRRALREPPNAAELTYMLAQGVWGEILTFERYHRDHPGNPWNVDRALLVSGHADRLAVPGSIPALLSDFHEPTLMLSSQHRDLLEAASRGATDAELARDLGLKLPTIKKRWAAVFQHIAQVNPELLDRLDDRQGRPTRGRQKRHHLLAYLREHPEELRPWVRPANNHARRVTR